VANAAIECAHGCVHAGHARLDRASPRAAREGARPAGNYVKGARVANRVTPPLYLNGGTFMADPTFPAIEIPGAGRLYARLNTTQGVIVIELEEKRAPKTVANFVGLATGKMAWTDPESKQRVNTPMYDGVRFHRVIPGFMVQVGDPQSRYTEMKSLWGTGGPGYRFGDEIHPELRHTTGGMLSMANAGANTNGSQFFITEGPTPHLDGRHAVFGRVIVGQDVVKKIASVKRNERDMPLEDQLIDKVELFRSESAPTG
jgi:peptidyl-prolyl cis-trans isomerase A (cyclophilin A)